MSLLKEAKSYYLKVFQQSSTFFSPENLNFKTISMLELFDIYLKNKEKSQEKWLHNFLSHLSKEAHTHFSLQNKIIIQQVLIKLYSTQDKELYQKFQIKFHNLLNQYNRIQKIKNFLKYLMNSNIQQNGYSLLNQGKVVYYHKINKVKGPWAVKLFQEKDFTKIINTQSNIIQWNIHSINKKFSIPESNWIQNKVIKLQLPSWLPNTELLLFHSGFKNINSFIQQRNLTVISIMVMMFIIVLFISYLIIRLYKKEIELSHMKSNFLSTISHEMRLPLSTIKMANESLEVGKIQKSKISKYHNYIDLSIQRLDNLISQILNFTRIKSQNVPLNLERINLSQMIMEEVETITEVLTSKGFIIEHDIDNEIYAYLEVESFSRAMLNLIQNAEKYSYNEKWIKISLKKDKKSIILNIQDRGCGIPKHKIPYLTQTFYRAEDELTRNTKGLGLGLAITEQIMKKHHGRIEIESKVNIGSTFKLILPLKYSK